MPYVVRLVRIRLMQMSEWHHIAATYDGKRMEFYRDGKAHGFPVARAGDIDYPTTASLMIGGCVITNLQWQHVQTPFCACSAKLQIYNGSMQTPFCACSATLMLLRHSACPDYACNVSTNVCQFITKASAAGGFGLDCWILFEFVCQASRPNTRTVAHLNSTFCTSRCMCTNTVTGTSMSTFPTGAP